MLSTVHVQFLAFLDSNNIVGNTNNSYFLKQVLEKDTDARTETIKTAKDLPAPDPEISAARWHPVPADLAHPKRAEL